MGNKKYSDGWLKSLEIKKLEEIRKARKAPAMSHIELLDLNTTGKITREEYQSELKRMDEDDCKVRELISDEKFLEEEDRKAKEYSEREFRKLITRQETYVEPSGRKVTVSIIEPTEEGLREQERKINSPRGKHSAAYSDFKEYAKKAIIYFRILAEEAKDNNNKKDFEKYMNISDKFINQIDTDDKVVLALKRRNQENRDGFRHMTLEDKDILERKKLNTIDPRDMSITFQKMVQFLERKIDYIYFNINERNNSIKDMFEKKLPGLDKEYIDNKKKMELSELETLKELFNLIKNCMEFEDFYVAKKGEKNVVEILKPKVEECEKRINDFILNVLDKTIKDLEEEKENSKKRREEMLLRARKQAQERQEQERKQHSIKKVLIRAIEKILKKLKE